MRARILFALLTVLLLESWAGALPACLRCSTSTMGRATATPAAASAATPAEMTGCGMNVNPDVAVAHLESVPDCCTPQACAATLQAATQPEPFAAHTGAALAIAAKAQAGAPTDAVAFLSRMDAPKSLPPLASRRFTLRL